MSASLPNHDAPVSTEEELLPKPATVSTEPAHDVSGAPWLALAATAAVPLAALVATVAWAAQTGDAHARSADRTLWLLLSFAAILVCWRPPGRSASKQNGLTTLSWSALAVGLSFAALAPLGVLRSQVLALAAALHVVALIARLPLRRRPVDGLHRLASLALTQFLLRDAQLLGAAPWPLNLTPLWQGSGMGVGATLGYWIALAIPPFAAAWALPLLRRDPLADHGTDREHVGRMRAALALSIAAGGALSTGLAAGLVALAASRPGRLRGRVETASWSLVGLLCVATSPAASLVALVLVLGLRRPRYGLSSLVVGAALLALVGRSDLADLFGVRFASAPTGGVAALALVLLALLLAAPSLRGAGEPGRRNLLWAGVAVGALLLPAGQALALPIFLLTSAPASGASRSRWPAWAWLALAALMAMAPWARADGIAGWVQEQTALTPALLLHLSAAFVVAAALGAARASERARSVRPSSVVAALAGIGLVVLLLTTFPGSISRRLLIWPPVNLEVHTDLAFDLAAADSGDEGAVRTRRWLVLDGALATAPATTEPVVVVTFEGDDSLDPRSVTVLESGHAFDDWAARRDQPNASQDVLSTARVLTRIATRADDGRPFLAQRYRSVVAIPPGARRLRVTRAPDLTDSSQVTLDRIFVRRAKWGSWAEVFPPTARGHGEEPR